MGPKRKTTFPPPDTGSLRKRAKRTCSRPVLSSRPVFNWRSQHWLIIEKVSDHVSVLTSQDKKQLVVMKVMRTGPNTENDRRPLEIRALSILPDCNRIVKPVFYAPTDEGPTSGTAIFAHYPLGDLQQWKESHFNQKRWKPVPESFIWRFFVQMSQALAILQNASEPRRQGQGAMLHRDIKPENILVVDNGTTYPSFKLHDFGCALLCVKRKASLPARCGTYEWQPPENPFINTKAAEVWALGACVHYLATEKPPIEDLDSYRAIRRKELNGADPPSARNYSPPSRYYAYKVPRVVTPINLSEEEQLECEDLLPKGKGGPKFYYQYSDELNDWMEKCLSPKPDKRPTVKTLIGPMIKEARQMLKKMGGLAALTDLEVEIGP